MLIEIINYFNWIRSSWVRHSYFKSLYYSWLLVRLPRDSTHGPIIITSSVRGLLPAPPINSPVPPKPSLFPTLPLLKKKVIVSVFSIYCVPPKYPCTPHTPHHTAPPKPLYPHPNKKKQILSLSLCTLHTLHTLLRIFDLPPHPHKASFSPSPPLHPTKHPSPPLHRFILPLLQQIIVAATPSFSPFLLHTPFFSPPSATTFDPFPRLLICR